MNRGPTGVDRQRTNMYWPEEENTPSVHEFSPSRNLNGGRRRPSSSRDSSSRTSSISSQSGLFDDVNTRELVRKQQESKIQFYDYDQAHVPPSRTITPSSVARNLSRESPEADHSDRKLETLKSRIEFYDYVDEGPPPAATRPVPDNGRRESERRPPPPSTTVVNKSRDSNFIQETYAPEDRTDGRVAKSSNTATTANTTRTTINHNIHADKQHSQQRSTQPPAPARRVPIESVDYAKEEQDRISSQTRIRTGDLIKSAAAAKKPLSSSVIDLSTLDLDDPELEQLKKLKPPSKNDIQKKLASFHTEIRVAPNSRSDRDRYDRSPPRSTIHHHSILVDQARSDGMRQSNSANTTTSASNNHNNSAGDRRDGRNRDPVKVLRGSVAVVGPEAPNEARRNAHRHLHSSFSFGDAQPAASRDSRRPNSIRDTAVCRVGVGLPDL